VKNREKNAREAGTEGLTDPSDQEQNVHRGCSSDRVAFVPIWELDGKRKAKVVITLDPTPTSDLQKNAESRKCCDTASLVPMRGFDGKEMPELMIPPDLTSAWGVKNPADLMTLPDARRGEPAAGSPELEKSIESLGDRLSFNSIQEYKTRLSNLEAERDKDPDSRIPVTAATENAKPSFPS
jgi:hypothetical protein